MVCAHGRLISSSASITSRTPIFRVSLPALRALTDQYPDRFTVAEVGGDDREREMKAFTAGETHFNSAYGFDFLYADTANAGPGSRSNRGMARQDGMGWPSWAFSNHDAPRWISRWAPADARDEYARMVMLLFFCLRGNVIIWQGEELGLTQVDIRSISCRIRKRSPIGR